MLPVTAVSLIFLTACTGVHEIRYSLQPAPNECQVTEVRVTTMSTLTSGVCWDIAGRPIGMVGGAGKPAVSVPLEVMGAAATVAGPVGAAFVLGRYIYKTGQDSSIPIPVSGSVDVTASQLPHIPPGILPPGIFP